MEDSTALIALLPQSLSNNLGSPLFRGNSFDLIASSVAAPFGGDLMSFPSFSVTGSGPASSTTAVASNPALGGPLTRMHSLDPYSGFNLTGAVSGDVPSPRMFLEDREAVGKRSLNVAEISTTDDQPQKLFKRDSEQPALVSPISVSGKSSCFCSLNVCLLSLISRCSAE